MVILRGANPLGPDNRDQRGMVEIVDERVKKYMQMDDQEWDQYYDFMFHDRKYPGQDDLKMLTIPGIIYTGFIGYFGFSLYLTRSQLFSGLNLVKFGMVPLFSAMVMRNIDIAWDILKYRKKYPEMYQP